MSSQQPGVIRRFFRGLWDALNFTRRLVFNLIFLAVLLAFFGAFFASRPLLAPRTALVLDPSGAIVEQYSTDPTQRALSNVAGNESPEVQLRDLLRAIDAAAKDSRIERIVLIPDEITGLGLATARELGAALDRFKAGGKEVIAVSGGMGQNEYLLAAHANRILLDPEGAVLLEGFANYRSYYKDALDKLGVEVHLIKVGTFKSAAEPYVLSQASDASKEADAYWMGGIWQEYLVRTGDPSLIAFKLHDFGYRGSTSDESAALGGAAHLVNFKGTDNLAGCELAMRYYRAQMPGFSIPAAEHSTITAWGRERELDAYANMLRAYPDSPLIAVVSDSYDIFHAVSELWGKSLRDAVMARRGAVVIRPDSGKPDEVVVSVLRRLAATFGARVNAKGYKVLDDHVRVIQGDGIDYDSIRTILESMALDGWSADNLTMGSGGGLLQKVDRDTQRFAFKCSAVRIGDTWSPVSKAPITDPGKNSKAGRLKLVRINGEHATVAEDNSAHDEMVEVFRDGELLKEWTFDEVRERAALTS